MTSTIRSLLASLSVMGLFIAAVVSSAQAQAPAANSVNSATAAKTIILAQGAPARNLTPEQRKRRAEQRRKRRQQKGKARARRPGAPGAKPRPTTNRAVQKKRRDAIKRRARKLERRKLNQQKARNKRQLNRQQDLRRQAAPSQPRQPGGLDWQKYRPTDPRKAKPAARRANPAARRARPDAKSPVTRLKQQRQRLKQRSEKMNATNQRLKRRSVAVKRRRNIKRRQARPNKRAFTRLQRKRKTLRNQINRQRNRKVRIQRTNRRLARQRSWLRSQRRVGRRGPRRDFAFRRRARVVEKRGNRTILTALAGAAVGAAIVGAYYVHHNDDNRIDWRSRDVYVDDLDNGWTRNVVIRPNGVRVVTVRDGSGFIVRRYRVYPGNRVTMLYDNQPSWWDEGNLAVEVQPARYSGPRDRYIVEPSRASVDTVYDTIVADPVEEIGRTYTLNQILVNANLRGYMPRIDLDSISFASGSASIPESQLDRLDSIGAAMEEAIKENPNEVYLIEGHTDATGSKVDNLTLSDERASAVANALTEYYEIPPENLVTQGYGEQFLKVDTYGSESRNRRVAIRRITPLLANDSQDIALDDDGNEIFDDG
ncbi:MAG: OmpA family protein [Alphaproteobacteria bacterium]|nr:OmpA family protein [Alphaproteobacteria bacterium]